jgi:hypothetical protein
MATREIPSHEWPRFFADCIRDHQGQPVTLKVFGADIGAQEEARTLPFVGISADWKDGENRVFVTVGDQLSDHLTHTITDPTHIRMRQAEGEAGETIEIEAADGTRTLVSFDL